MHVKNTHIKKKFREILLTKKDSENTSFDFFKRELSMDPSIKTKEERNIIAGLLAKKLKPKK